MLENVEVKIFDARIGTKWDIPVYGTSMSAGLDVRAVLDEPLTLKPGDVALVGTGIGVFLNNPNYTMLMAPRSGTAHKRHIGISNSPAILDADYQGEIKISVRNLSNDQDLVVEPGERIAQIVIAPVIRPELKIVQEFSAVTERGTGGFGSTNTN